MLISNKSLFIQTSVEYTNKTLDARLSFMFIKLFYVF